MDLAIAVHEYGGPEQLRAERAAAAAPGRAEVLLRQTAVGVNFIDVYHRTGLYPLPQLPHGIGSEAVGVVEAIGPGVTGLSVGDRVGYAIGGAPGAYAVRRVVPAWRLVPLPRGIDDVTAAGLLLKGLTAEMLVRRVHRVGPRQRVLVHAAAGGVGLLLCQWLRHLGAYVIGTVSTDAKAEVAGAHGCHLPIVTTRDDFPAVVRGATKGKGVDVVYDSVGRTTFSGSLQCLRPRGLLVSFGNASGPPAPLAPAELARHGSLFLTRPSLGDYTRTVQELRRAAAALFTVVQQGAVVPPAPRQLPLAQAAEAHRLLESRATTGPLVLVP
ncbi:MAG: quinone oxidoreductase [Planctomycetota bacterium]